MTPRNRRTAPSRALRRAGVLAWALVAGSLAGCGDGEARLAQAEAALAAGRLEAAARTLDGLEGSRAAALAARLETRLAARRASLAAIEDLLDQAPEPRYEALEAALLAVEGRGTDPVVAEAIERAHSRLADRYAAARAAGRRWPESPEALTEQVGAEVEEAREESLAQRFHASRGDTAEDASRSNGQRVEQAAGAEAAERSAEQAAEQVVDRALGVAAREPAARPRPSAPVDVAPPPVRADWRSELARMEQPAALRAYALGAELDGALQPARAGLLRALGFEADPAAREALRMQLARLEARLGLRAELAALQRQAPERFAAGGVLAIGEEGARFDGAGEALSFARLAAEDWQQLADLARRTVPGLSASARLGLAAELLAKGDEVAGDLVLARLVDEDEVDAQLVWSVVAWHRDEAVPGGGYAWRDERWIPAEEADAAERAARVTRLVRAFPTLDASRRDAGYDELFALAGRDVAAEALTTRWARALSTWDALRGRGALERMAEARHELDRRRDELLTRIEDGYAYPDDTSTPGAVERKAESQRFIDERTAELRRHLDDTGPARLNDSAREFLAELRWLEEREHELRLERTLRPAALPPWLLAQDPDASRLTLEAFAWTRSEAAALARDRAVLRRNEELLAERDRPEVERADREEARQVELTNAYRRLLGRRVLAWDPRLQAAAADHSEYMVRTGDFGHTETTPGRETASARMRARGYPRPGGENCYAGGVGAEGAHTAWLHSPGHHRNIVAAGHTAMASAVDGQYWTQVFGGDTAFLDELERWSD